MGKRGRQAEGNEKAKFTGSSGGDQGYAEGKERMVSIARGAVYHADSGDMRSNLIRKGGNVWKKQGTVAKEIP